MSSGDRVPIDQAREIAEELVSLLAPSCERIEVAGSIRRSKPDIGDIDLVCEPKVRPLTDMFGDATGEDLDELHDLCDRLAAEGVIGKRLNKDGKPSWGKSLKRATFKGLGVDIQSCRDRDSWGFWLLIRTGPAELNKALVTPRHQGGLLPPGFEIRDGFHLYRHGGRIPTPTEQSVFEALGIPYVAPELRATALHGAEGGGA